MVSATWLCEHLDAKNLVVLDASISKVSDASTKATTVQIPKARFFDIKKAFSIQDAPFPNTLPTVQQFTEAIQKLGITTSSVVVVYDDKGIYSSARAWYLCKAFGLKNVAVLDGGLPTWITNGFEVEEKQTYIIKKGDFVGILDKSYFIDFKGIQKLIQQQNSCIIDARSAERFLGEVPEPRKGLRSGTIPSSVNLHYQEVLHKGKLKAKTELRKIFQSIQNKNKPFVFSCGSGVTACILALAAENIGIKDKSIYDGSWTEYGSIIK